MRLLPESRRATTALAVITLALAACALEFTLHVSSSLQHFVVCRLDAVGDVSGQLLFEVNGFLSDRCVERHGVPDRFRRGSGPADDLHKRYDVRRVERVADDGSLRTPALGLHDAHRDAR